MTATPPPVARALGLQPHPEGGWFAEVFRSESEVVVSRPAGEQRRAAATLINYLLPAGEASAWHTVASPEIWIWQGPGTIRLQLGGEGEWPDDDPVTHRLGPGFESGELPQIVVPAGVWQRTLPGDEDALAACLVSPGFDFADFRLL